MCGADEFWTLWRLTGLCIVCAAVVFFLLGVAVGIQIRLPDYRFANPNGIRYTSPGSAWTQEEEDVIGTLWDLLITDTPAETATVLSFIMKQCGYYRRPQSIHTHKKQMPENI